MRAIVQLRYGPPDAVLELREIDRPVPRHDEVLVRVHAASLHPDVWHVVRGWPRILRVMGAGLRRPKNPVPGTDLAGRIESVGEDVTTFRPGDEVFGESIKVSQWVNGGTFAEYATVPQDSIVTKPPGITFEEAAAVPTSGSIALTNLRDQARVRPGQRVLVNGAGGGVGIFSVQLAKAFGAEVTAVDRTDKLDLLRSIGADRAIDHTEEDFTRGGERYDLVIDIPGNHPFSHVRRALAPDGTYVLIGHDGYGRSGGRWLGSLPRFFRLAAISPFVRQLPRLRFSSPSKKESMTVLKQLLEEGKIRPVVDRTFPLTQVPQAIRYLAQGRGRGKVVITM